MRSGVDLLFRTWNWALDPVRSMPHRWLLCWELSLAVSVLTATCLGLYLSMRLLQSLRQDEIQDAVAVAQLDRLGQVPKTYKLASHSDVRSEVDGEIIDALDACHEVSVLEIQSSDNMSGDFLKRLPRRVKSIFSSKTPQTLWGRLQKPEGHRFVMSK